MLCWTKYNGYAYDVDYRDPKLCSIKSDASYDSTPIDNAMHMYRLRFHGSSTVLFWMVSVAI